MAVVLSALAGLALMLFLLFYHRGPAPQYAPFQSIKITRLTSTGKATSAAISPDGRYVVYEVGDGEQRSLWVRQVVTNSNVNVVAAATGVKYLGVTFSRDGDYIYYVRKEQNSPVGELFQVPVLGGDSRKIIYDVDTPITFSPDGKRLAFMRGDPNTKEVTLITASVDGTEERKIARREYPLWWDAPAWSPDGRVIACLAWSNAELPQVSVVEVPAEGGAEKTIAAPGRIWWRSGQLTWLADGSGLLMNAPVEESPTSLQIWHISYPGGTARRVTSDLNFYSGVSLTRDSTALVTVQVNEISNVWMAQGGDAARARQITSGANNYFDPDFTPDGKIVYASMISGNPEIWVMDQEGNNQKQLTANQSLDIQPSVSADGRYIVFISDRAGKTTDIWRMDINGGNPKQLTSGNGGLNPQCTPDSRWVVYSTSSASGTPSLWKVSIDGGEPVLITDEHTSSPVISPDGKLIACAYWDLKDTSKRLRIALFPIDGGEPVKTFDIPNSNLRWTADGRALTYINTRNGVSNLWIQPIEGGTPRQLTTFNADRIFNYAWSRDGKQLMCSRGTVTSDVVLISDFSRGQDKK
jgi:Tol biopolymer transport system component